MNKAGDSGSCWPTWRQELLLRAALLQGRDTIQAWQKWRSNVDIDQLDPGSYRLLPLLYRNLRAQGIEDPLMGRLKGIYRRTWCENRLFLYDMSRLLRRFQDAGIETMVLKGAALTMLFYEDYGLRPMDDFDVLVHRQDAETAVALLLKLGCKELSKPVRWNQAGTFVQPHVLVANSCGFKNPAGRAIDLHWHVLYDCCYAHADDDFWDGAVSVELDDVSTRALNPSDQLLHVCVHGARWNPVPPIRWLADAMLILKASECTIDWNRLLAQAEKRRFTLPLRETLTYLRDGFAAPIPDAVLSDARRIPVSAMERIEYKYKSRDYTQRLLSYLPLLWFYYLRSTDAIRSWRKLVGFVEYLQYVHGLRYLWQVPAYVTFLGIRKGGELASLYKNRLGALLQKAFFKHKPP